MEMCTCFLGKALFDSATELLDKPNNNHSNIAMFAFFGESWETVKNVDGNLGKFPRRQASGKSYNVDWKTKNKDKSQSQLLCFPIQIRNNSIHYKH